MMEIPPPIIDCSKVILFAKNDDDVEYTDRIDLHVGGKSGFERIGELPHLVISEPYNWPDTYLLMFCDEDWVVKGVLNYTTIDEAKIKAERGYKGISEKWQECPYDEESRNDFLRDEYEVDPKSEWWTSICSFCGRKDSEFKSILVGKYASICKECVASFYKAFNEDS